MTWTAFHRRADVLRAVVVEADQRLDGTLPTDVPGVVETFDGDLDLLGALQLRWHTRLAGRVERELAHVGRGSHPDPAAAVRAAWVATADDLPGVRAVLDAHRRGEVDALPEVRRALRKAAGKDRAMLAVSAGLASVHDARAEVVGQRLEAEARRDRAAQHAAPAARSFVRRLRAAVAAA